jgi:DNA-binding response OmpR family regulator
MPSRVLVIEDEAGIRMGLETTLRVAGFEVETLEDGKTALQRASTGKFDVILLDLILPDKDGLAVCLEFREHGIDTPVVMVTARSELEDRLRGFAAGADDYLVKPFESLELLARIRAVLKRRLPAPGSSASHVEVTGGLRVDRKTATAWRDGNRVELSVAEYELLLFFMDHETEILSRECILREAWISKPGAWLRSVDVLVNSLRKKVEDDPKEPRRIQTVYGKGYVFMPY